MTRTFIHSFDPPGTSPVAGPTVDLEVSEIEDAGIREVLQTPGAAYGAWSIIDALLAAIGPGTPLIFEEPLGQAREVKVALSGLFGRFVDRVPLDEGEPIDPDDKDALFIGLLRQHIAGLIAPLGHEELAEALRCLARERFPRGVQRDVTSARTILDAAPFKDASGASIIDGLVGGIVTRAGPLSEASVPASDQDVLARLNLRPAFVGIERDLIRAAIDGEAKMIRDRLADRARPDDAARSDRAGGWIIPLDQGRRIV